MLILGLPSLLLQLGPLISQHLRERALAIGQIRAWDSTLYARFAVNSEAGLVPSANAWGDDEDGEPMVRIAYRVL